MKLTAFNGSPRGAGGNSQALLQELVKGFESIRGNTAETVCLRDAKDFTALRDKFSQSDAVVLAFPLYVDAMPSMVKEFIEALEPLCGGKGNPMIGFSVISGFPEGVHISYVAKYLEKLAGRLGCPYAGTIAMGNGEGVRHAKEKARSKIFQAFYQCGASLADTGRFDEDTIRQLAGTYRYSPFMIAIYNFIRMLGLTDIGWNNMLKANGAFEKRLDRPDE